MLSRMCLSFCLFVVEDPCTGPWPFPPPPRHDQTCSTATSLYSNLPTADTFKRVHYEARTVGKRAAHWHSIEMSSCFRYKNSPLSTFLITGRNEVVAKVIFLHVSVIHSVHRGEGVCLSACWDTTTPRDQADPPRTRQTTTPLDQADHHPPGPGRPPPRPGRPPWTRQTPQDQADHPQPGRPPRPGRPP